MAQVKKAAVRDAILDAAFRLFRAHGYAATTITMIAGEAGCSTANVYVYFPSKFRIAFTLYDSWFRARVEALRAHVHALPAPRDRLFAILHALWCEIPRADNGFANCFMEAISTLGPEDSYEPTLLRWAEAQIGALLRDCLPEAELVAPVRLARVALMAFDGFAIGRKLSPDGACDHATIEQMVDLLLPPRPARRQAKASSQA
ncbi:TetR/AcrR family transcriptional regulator [Falsiroseomonas oryzae]|uniref:TetR/AcrR family transcriptional regulator n=1 Tax=Falsiroseomonas oryzae TaxID=2766473 RepID=UPI0022EB6F65|nr:TetR/AcrR family transcriptional regulator [Roseomonas sp. MO-31]